MISMARLRRRDVNVAQLLVRLENYKQSAIRSRISILKVVSISF